MKKGLIFDLDGTLLNSLYDIALSMNEVLKINGFEQHKIEKYNYFVGDGAYVLVKNALPSNISEEILKKVLQDFIDIYESDVHHNTKPYEGIIKLLDELEKLNTIKGVLSNKPHKFTLKYVETNFSNYNFKEIHGQKEDVPKKPNPFMAIEISKSFNLKPKDIFFVGDTSTDMKTAKAAGMNAIGVSWGFRPIEELLEFGADYIVNHPLEIIDIIKKS